MPSYVFTYRQPKDQPLNMEAAEEWFKWFDEIGEHITVPGSAVSTARQVGNVDGAQRVLAKAERDGQFAAARKRAGTYSSREHATKVAWRVVKDWLEANLALIAAQMATIDEVMLPYLHVGDDKTLWQAYREREQAAFEERRGEARPG